MDRKPTLSFYTNMPTPYQLDFFGALKEYFDLKVIYFTARESDRQWQLSTSGDGYTVMVLHNNRFALWVQKRISSFHFDHRIISLLCRDKAEYVLVNGTYWSPNVLLAIGISFFRKKKVAFWTEPVFPVNNRIRFLLKKLMLWPVNHCTHFLLAVGKKTEQTFRRYGYKKNIHNIPYNIDVRLFCKEHLKSDIIENLRRQYKSGGEIILLSSGSLIHRKGMDTVIRAFLKLPAQLNARLLIIGEGEEMDTLAELSGNTSNIHLLGFQEKEMIPYWFNLADIFVFASRYDGWGLVINEAIAAGNAIICSKAVGAATDKLIDQYNAILQEAEDIDGFFAAMLRLITEEQVRNEMVLNSRFLKAELSSEYNARKLYDIYRSAE